MLSKAHDLRAQSCSWNPSDRSPGQRTYLRSKSDQVGKQCQESQLAKASNTNSNLKTLVVEQNMRADEHLNIWWTSNDPIQAARLCFPKPTISSICRWSYGFPKFLSSVRKGTRAACQITLQPPYFASVSPAKKQVHQVNTSKKSEDGMKRGCEVHEVRRDVQSSDCPKVGERLKASSEKDVP